MAPGGGVGMPKQGTSAKEVAARAGKVELLPTTVKVEGVQGKAVTKEFKWPINDNLPPKEITALEKILDEFRDVFAFDASELGIIEGETYHIKLTDETPIFNNSISSHRQRRKHFRNKWRKGKR
jgi:hypothetical protein